MQVFSEIVDIRQARWKEPSTRWGLVPTMGFLHEGHLNLVRRARNENDRVGVSIFVNPIQFNETKDLVHYPRDLQRDLALLEKEGVDLVWTPTPEQVYPENFQTYITVEKISQPLEGKARPGHFRGVTTVVSKLFNIFQPDRAYFGQKDAQQVAVIKQMADDLNFNLEIIICPTVREADGLAMSSRNARLSPQGREDAAWLYRSLTNARVAFEQGIRDAQKLKGIILKTLQEKNIRVDYISIVNPVTLQELEIIQQEALVSLAAFVDEVRLIDNMIIG
ncbi:pantoate--beta-alanine ligase [candidate division KSB1 bacterium]|nr:pantoate--beta-alanine ligase [candidate division KSB1 bacterium]